jgi:hypothetical protein
MTGNYASAPHFTQAATLTRAMKLQLARLRLIIPPRSPIQAPSTHDADLKTTVEELRRASNRGCRTCSLLYYATRDTLFSYSYKYNDINVKVWYGSGHLGLFARDFRWINQYGTIFVESGR